MFVEDKALAEIRVAEGAAPPRSTYRIDSSCAMDAPVALPDARAPCGLATTSNPVAIPSTSARRMLVALQTAGELRVISGGKCYLWLSLSINPLNIQV